MTQFVKLNARYRAYPNFKWAMNCGYVIRNAAKFHEIRQWCWESFGSSDELDIWQNIDSESRNTQWCWDYIDRSQLRIYLNEEAYEWAILKWK